MVQFFSKRRLKIAEQIIIVIFFAVLIPMTISGVIINNINQQSTRAQLRSGAVLISKIVFKVLSNYSFSKTIKEQILYLIKEFLEESINIDYIINPKINRLLIVNFFKKTQK